MKNILIILFLCFTGLSVSAQSEFRNPDMRPKWYNKLKTDFFWLNTTDTANQTAAGYEGALIYQKDNKTVYVSDGTYWKKISSDGYSKQESDSLYQPKMIYTSQYINSYSNSTFILSYPPIPNTPVKVELNGINQDPTTYTVSGTTVTFNFTPNNEKIVVWYYRKAN